jgi:hypothetical protein
MRILFFEKVDDSFPGTCRKPLAAWTNSFDEGKRGVQFNLVNLLCSFVINEAIFLTTLEINHTAAFAPYSLRRAPASIMKVVVADHNY